MIKDETFYNVINLVVELCNINSTTGKEEHVIYFIEQLMLKNKFNVFKQKVDDNNRSNLLITIDKNTKLKVLLCTHIDTVPPFFSPKILYDKGIIVGRGVCDAKGIAAAMICSLLKLKKCKNNEVGLLILVGEETVSDGAKKAINGFVPKVKYLINGEPTNLCLVKAVKGIISFKIYVYGKSGHSSDPNSGYSAIHQLNNDLHCLLNNKWNCNKKFGKTTLNVGKIKGGIASNIISDYAEAYCTIRASTRVDLLYEEIKNIISMSTKINIYSMHSPMKLFYLKNYKLSIVSFASDLNILKILGSPLLFGPGNISYAHSLKEQISIYDLKRSVDMYTSLSLKLLYRE